MLQVFKRFSNNDVVNTNNYSKFTPLNVNGAYLFKGTNSGWSFTTSSTYSDYSGIKPEYCIAESQSFSVAYCSQLTSSVYSEYLSFQSIMGLLGVPYSIAQQKYNFKINGSSIDEVIAISFDPERYDEHINPNSFVIALSGSTSTASTAISGDTFESAKFLALTPYTVRESVYSPDTTVTLSSTPIYELKWHSADTFVDFDFANQTVSTDWSTSGMASTTYGYIFPEQGLVLIIPSLLPTQIKNAINDTGKARCINALNSIQYIGGYGSTKLEKKIFFIRLDVDEFNFTANPTAFKAYGTKNLYNEDIRNEPFTFISAMGIYNDQNELLITAQLSEPVKKSQHDNFTYKIVVEI